MIRFVHRLAAASALATSFAFATATAEKVPEDKLKDLASVMPAAPQGYARNPALGVYSSDSASSATATYRSSDGKSFSIVVTFSKTNAKQNADMMKNPTQLKTFGYDVTKVKGRDALARKPENKNKFSALYLVVLGERVVSATDSTGTADPAIVKAVFESIDFDAVAKK